MKIIIYFFYPLILGIFSLYSSGRLAVKSGSLGLFLELALVLGLPLLGIKGPNFELGNNYFFLVFKKQIESQIHLFLALESLLFARSSNSTWRIISFRYLLTNETQKIIT